MAHNQAIKCFAIKMQNTYLENKMKKIDFHIHTVKTISDSYFEFSLEKLKQYVIECDIDAIAITNHNFFDLNQFLSITEELRGLCTVFPGIEINIGDNSLGHILCISEPDRLDDFNTKSTLINAEIETPSDYIGFEKLSNIFGDLENYLWIPHYDKKPNVNKSIISKMGENIICGEVHSAKKFIYCIKDEKEKTPVLFSDCRLTDSTNEFPSRHTFVNVDELTIKAIKRSLLNKNNITLSEQEGNSRYNILSDLIISSGLNVILGGRSSGKTYTLNRIAENNDNIKYIKQFELLERDTEKAAQKFNERIAAKQSSISKDYFQLFAQVIDDIKTVSIDDDTKRIEKYINSLKKHASEQNRKDQFSRSTLYSETKYSIDNLETLQNVIDSVKVLIDAKRYSNIIEKYLQKEDLTKLYVDLITQYNKEKELVLKKEWINEFINDVQHSLQARTSITMVKDVDFLEIKKNRNKVEKFKELAELVKKEAVIQKNTLEGFTIQATKKPFKGPLELKKESGRRDVAFSEIYEHYLNNPYKFLVGIINMPDISEVDYYKFFAKVDYQILNKYGFELSGGERAEFNLIQEINDAYQYDMLLIDEPESSFDNMFLKENVNKIIKDISLEMPVIIVTHNSTIGASIKPDYLIYTRRSIDGKEVHYERYCGLPSSKYLISNSGEKIQNRDIMLNSLEAGEEAYEERRAVYDLLKE